jgi:hypothetical protein
MIEFCLPRPNIGHFGASIRYHNVLRLSYIAIGPANAH